MAETREIVESLEKLLGAEAPARAAELFARLKEALSADEVLLARSSRLSELGAQAASVMHELKQPLLGVKAFSQLLGEHADAAVRERAQAILKQAERMESLVARHRDFLEDDGQERVELDLSEVAREAISVTSHHLSACKARLETALAPGLPRLKGYRRQLVHAVGNLLANAADAVEAVGGGQVKVETGAEGAELFVSVADWGAGVAPEAREKLFTSFFTTKGSDRGTGLGLTICRRVAKNHQGRVELWAPPGGLADPPRTVFRVTLPLQAVTAIPAVGPTRAAAAGSVLLVDDESVVRSIVRKLLAPDGYEVVEAECAEDAMKLVAERDFDLLVADKNLPGMDGLRLIELVRKMRPEMRAIVITGYPSAATARQGFELGIVDYLTKPFDDVRAVRATIQAALAQKRKAAPVHPGDGRVLIFETAPEFRGRIAEALARLRMEAVSVSTLEEARQAAGPGLSAAVVSWESAGGEEALEQIRSLVSTRPLVIFSDQVSLDKMRASAHLGAKACMPRLNVSVEALAEELARALGLPSPS